MHCLTLQTLCIPKYVKHCLATAVPAAAKALLLPNEIQAQMTGKPLEEIILTADKREQNLQDVPFSIAAVTEDEIRRQGSTTISEMARSSAGQCRPVSASVGQCRPVSASVGLTIPDLDHQPRTFV